MTRLVVGIGNRLRGDDAAGIRVLERLAATTLPSDVELLTREADLLGLLDAWAGRSQVVLVDAMRSGAAPGSVRRIEPPPGWQPQGFTADASSHLVGLGTVIELGRTLGRFPEHLVLFGIEAQSFAAGAPLDPSVEAAAEVVAAQVLAELGVEWAQRDDERAHLSRRAGSGA